MARIALLNSQTHRHIRIQPGASARYGDNQRFVSVILGEFPHLAAHYPILLSKDSNTGAFFIGAMLGFDEGENLFLDSRGMETYRPLNLQRGPFFTSGNDLAIDLDSPRIDDGGTALFTDVGEPTQYLQSIMALFRDVTRGVDLTKTFINTMVGMKLVEPIDISLALDDGKRSLTGLYTINEEVLRALPDETVLGFFRSGHLQLMYLMLASLKQLPVLARRKNALLLGASAGLAGI